MIRFLSRFLAALLLFGAAAALAQNNAVSGNAPVPPLTSSPVDLFRKLLATNTAGREEWMASRSAATRQYLEAKVREYEAMPAEQREARLQSLQLRWHMLHFMKMKPLERGPWLAAVPARERSLLQQRLGEWDILPPPLQKDVLENENLIRVFVVPEQGGGGKSNDVFASMSAEQRSELQRQFDRWNQLPAERKDQILAHFNKFFELRDADKNDALSKLTATERAQMEQTLSKFSSLPKEEREQAMQGFKKFAALSPAERAAFLKTAERWKAMSEKERETWRKVIASLQARRAAPLPPPVIRPALSSTN